MIIYLYIKQHRITTLKYFGATRKNPWKYNGSGTKWRSHLKKHGRFIDTLVVYQFDTPELCNEFALRFSRENNIVKSKEWANYIEEDAFGGNSKLPNNARFGCNNHFFGKTHTEAVKEKLRNYRKNSIMSKKQKEKMIKDLTGVPKSSIHKKKISEYSETRKWIVNKEGVRKHATNIHDPRVVSGEFQLGRVWKLKPNPHS